MNLTGAGAEIVDLEVPEVAIPMADAGILYTGEAWARFESCVSPHVRTALPPAAWSVLEEAVSGALDADEIFDWVAGKDESLPMETG